MANFNSNYAHTRLTSAASLSTDPADANKVSISPYNVAMSQNISMGYRAIVGSPANDPLLLMSYPQFSNVPLNNQTVMAHFNSDIYKKGIITLSTCVLYPNKYTFPQVLRARPPGCKTIYVGGLPENTTEIHLREVFERFGEILNIRMGKKHFCHVRFLSEESVDHAMCITGYRIKLENKDEKEYTGRLHIDYAQAKDDLYEWECKQRAMAREQRHRNKLEEEKLRGSSPPPINRYSDHEAIILLEKLKCDETFMEGVQVVVAWLERSECTRKSANQFYGFVQTIHAHVRRLINEKTTYDEELENVKFRFRQRLEYILKQFEQIDRVFTAATQQKAWDHFSKAQRKNIDVWRKQAQDTKEQQEREFLSNREELEMEMSDSEDEPSTKKKKADETQTLDYKQEFESEIKNLKEENDSLKCQVEAYKIEVDLLRQEAKKQNSEKKIEQLEHALHGMQKEFLNAKDDGKKCCLDEKNIVSSSQNEIGLNEIEAKLICYISTFLHVHPFGASLDYIWSYLQKFDLTFRTSELETLLERFPNIFNSQMHGIGANIEKRWRYVALDKI